MNSQEPVPKRLMTKKQAAARYSVSERQIDIFRHRGMPWLSVGPRKILLPITECDAWITRLMIVRQRPPSEYRPRAATVINTTANLAAKQAPTAAA